MLFSTKAEYGVRLMVELGRQPSSQPISLSTVAEAERLPLSYLEHLVAKLRKAGLVTSTRGAHGHLAPRDVDHHLRCCGAEPGCDDAERAQEDCEDRADPRRP